MTNQPQFQRSADTRFLMQELAKAKVGEEITYDRLTKAIGREVSGSTASLHSARRALLKEQNFVFDTIVGVGLKRLSDREIVATSAKTAKHMRRTAQRGVRTLTAVGDFSALPREDQMRHSAAVSIFSAVAEMAAERSISKIEDVAKDRPEGLPFAQTLEAFRSHK